MRPSVESMTIVRAFLLVLPAAAFASFLVAAEVPAHPRSIDTRHAMVAGINAAAVAIRIAAHFFTIMPRAWMAEVGEEKVKAALQQGFELLKIGWERDEAALRKSIVGVLME